MAHCAGPCQEHKTLETPLCAPKYANVILLYKEKVLASATRQRVKNPLFNNLHTPETESETATSLFLNTSLLQMDLLEGLQGSKLSFSSRSDSDSPLHSHHMGTGLPSPGHAEGHSLPPHSAWQALLDSRLPFLLADTKAAADFLLLYTAAPGAPQQLGSPVNPHPPGACKAAFSALVSTSVCMCQAFLYSRF